MKSKSVALVLCFFFGWLGAHRFYMGRWFSAIVQMFTFGGFFVWWAIDFFVILFGKFRDSSGRLIGEPVQTQDTATQQVSSQNAQPVSLSVSQDDWIMQTKPTPYWKFLLEMNLFKAYQLDYVEKKGNTITVGVKNGKTYSFRIGEFQGSHFKSHGDFRQFTLKSIIGPKKKVIFMETHFQMPEKWWDELEEKLGASETKWSKFSGVLGKLENFLGLFQ